MNTDCVGFVLVVMVATIIFVAWLTIDQEEFDRDFKRINETAEKED